LNDCSLCAVLVLYIYVIRLHKPEPVTIIIILTCSRVCIIIVCTFVVVTPLVSRFYVRNSHGPPIDLAFLVTNDYVCFCVYICVCVFVAVCMCVNGAPLATGRQVIKSRNFPTHVIHKEGRDRVCMCMCVCVYKSACTQLTAVVGRFFKTRININIVFSIIFFFYKVPPRPYLQPDYIINIFP